MHRLELNRTPRPRPPFPNTPASASPTEPFLRERGLQRRNVGLVRVSAAPIGCLRKPPFVHARHYVGQLAALLALHGASPQSLGQNTVPAPSQALQAVAKTAFFLSTALASYLQKDSHAQSYPQRHTARPAPLRTVWLALKRAFGIASR